METSGLNAVIRHLRRVVLVSSSDEELLAALAQHHDETAFEVLLRRHGPMVWAVCTRVLHQTQDAEDAFQATFLVLVRKAATIRKRQSLPSWLYGVAYRTARKARAMNARRRWHEIQATSRPRPEIAKECPDLDQELSALPEKYRVPVILCELQGRTRKEVAHLLKIPEGTLSSRLATARKAMAKRLGERGALFIGGAAAPSKVPALLVVSTVKVVGMIMAGSGAAGVASANALILSHGVLRAMLMMKLKSLAVAVVVLGTLGLGVGRYTHRALAIGPVASGAEPQTAGQKPDQSGLGLEEAKAALKQAEAGLAAAQTKVERIEKQLIARGSITARELTKLLGRSCHQTFSRDVASRFKYLIPVELGRTESNEGSHLEILEIWGTRPQIEIGGQYMVHGRYTMPSRNKGKLYFYVTSTGPWGLSGEATFDLQSTTVDKGTGEFTLVHGLGGPGDFHLILYSADDGKNACLANVYFK